MKIYSKMKKQRRKIKALGNGIIKFVNFKTDEDGNIELNNKGKLSSELPTFAIFNEYKGKTIHYMDNTTEDHKFLFDDGEDVCYGQVVARAEFQLAED